MLKCARTASVRLAEALAIDPRRPYPPHELQERGIALAATLTAWRWRTKKTGKLHGPRWISLGNRIAYVGADLLEWIGDDSTEVAS